MLSSAFLINLTRVLSSSISMLFGKGKLSAHKRSQTKQSGLYKSNIPRFVWCASSAERIRSRISGTVLTVHKEFYASLPKRISRINLYAAIVLFIFLHSCSDTEYLLFRVPRVVCLTVCYDLIKDGISSSGKGVNPFHFSKTFCGNGDNTCYVGIEIIQDLSLWDVNF